MVSLTVHHSFCHFVQPTCVLQLHPAIAFDLTLRKEKIKYTLYLLMCLVKLVKLIFKEAFLIIEKIISDINFVFKNIIKIIMEKCVFISPITF